MRHKRLIFIGLWGLISCITSKQQATDNLPGTWDNKSGQLLVFRPNGQALWIFYKEAKRDTFDIQYHVDYLTKPHQFDLTGFKTGPLKGKTLYGIIEFSSPTSIRLDFEPSKENRPKDFDAKQTQTYFKSVVKEK